MDASPEFFNRVAASYGESWTIEEETRVAASMLAGRAASGEASANGSGRILEVGCGNGRALVNLSRRNPSAWLVGVDYAPEMLALARARVPTARFVQASALALPFRRGAFAVAVAANIIHNHEDPVPILREAGRAASHLVVDFRNRLNPIVAWRAWRWRAARFIRYTARTAASWRRELRGTGWWPRERLASPRPAVDPGTGFRWFHLAGSLISRIPGLAPVETWLCERRPGPG